MVKFFSFLGTTEYIPCTYYMEAQEKEPRIEISDCRYVQEALIKILIQKGVSFDEIVVFITEDSYAVNWIDNVYKRDGISRPGLHRILENIFSGCSVKIKNKNVPAGDSQEDLWKLFESMTDEIGQGDHIILDITHSFRFLPMLAFIVLSYARIIKKCEIKGIFYGALGSKAGNIQQTAEKQVPIFDLTPFVELFDWIIGVDRYVTTGDASIVKRLTLSETSRLAKNISEKTVGKENCADKALLYRKPNVLRKLSNAMEDFSDVIATCRGKIIVESALELKKAIDDVIEHGAHQYVKPLSYIMDMLKNRFNSFAENQHMSMLEAVRWCLDNHMYQQGLTILEEGLISFACDKYGLDKYKKEHRDMIPRCARDFIKGDNTDRYPIDKAFFENESLCQLIYNLCDRRNDINHAGWVETPAKPAKFKENLEEFLKKAEEIIYRHFDKDTLPSDNPPEEASKSPKHMFLIFSHRLTDLQRQQAETELEIDEFVYLPENLFQKWSNVPPDTDNLDEYLRDLMVWLDENASKGDYVLVQGDYGATFMIVTYCLKRKLIPVYATTRRVAQEWNEGGKIITVREFEHANFRRYDNCMNI